VSLHLPCLHVRCELTLLLQCQGGETKQLDTFSDVNFILQLYNLEQDLHMTDNQYLLTLTVCFLRSALFITMINYLSQIFFFSYAIFEVPSNIFLKRLRPSLWLSFLMLFWGIMMVIYLLCHLCRMFIAVLDPTRCRS